MSKTKSSKFSNLEKRKNAAIHIVSNISKIYKTFNIWNQSRKDSSIWKLFHRWQKKSLKYRGNMSYCLLLRKCSLLHNTIRTIYYTYFQIFFVGILIPACTNNSLQKNKKKKKSCKVKGYRQYSYLLHKEYLSQVEVLPWQLVPSSYLLFVLMYTSRKTWFPSKLPSHILEGSTLCCCV